MSSIAIRICRSGSIRSKRCCQYIYVAFGKRKAARISVSLNSLRRLLMILAALSFFERPRGAISSILLNRHSLFEHNVIVFPILNFGLTLRGRFNFFIKNNSSFSTVARYINRNIINGNYISSALADDVDSGTKGCLSAF